MNSLRPPWTALAIVASMAVFACLLRGSIAASEFLWLDELHTSWSVHGSMRDVASRAAEGNQSPLYFWLTWVVVSVCGDSEFSLRSISIISGIGTLSIASWFTWRWTGSVIAASLVAWLIAVNVQFVYYDSEARPYAFLQFLSVIQVSLFFEAIWGRQWIHKRGTGSESNRSVWPHWSLAVTSILLINTHLTSIWLILAEAIYLGIAWLYKLIGRVDVTAMDVDRSGAYVQWISAATVVGIGCLPILIQLTAVFERKKNWQSISSVSGLWTDTWPVMVALIVAPTICLAFSHLLARQVSQGTRSNLNLSRLAFLFLWAIVPIVSVIGLDLFRIAPMALQRYTLVGAVGFPVFAGFCLGYVSTTPGKLGLALLIVAATVFSNPIIKGVACEGQVPQLRFEDWKTPISEINSTDSKSHHPVFLFANLIEDRDAFRNSDALFQDYLLFPVSGLYELDAQDHNISAGPTLEFTHFSVVQIDAIKEQGGAWAIVRANLELVTEIGNELRTRTATVVGKNPREVTISIFETPNSPVYLLSVDW